MRKRTAHRSKRSPARGSKSLSRFRITFSVTDYYVRECRAVSAANALRNARRAYDQHHEQAFEFDISRGGPNRDWQVEEVL